MNDWEYVKLFLSFFLEKDFLYGAAYIVAIYGAIYLYAWLS